MDIHLKINAFFIFLIVFFVLFYLILELVIARSKSTSDLKKRISFELKKIQTEDNQAENNNENAYKELFYIFDAFIKNESGLKKIYKNFYGYLQYIKKFESLENKPRVFSYKRDEEKKITFNLFFLCFEV